MKVKKWVEEHAHSVFNYYRLIYCCISGAGLFGLLLLMMVSRSKVLFVASGSVKYMAMVLASWGVIIVVVAFRYLSGLAFLGLKKHKDVGLVREGVHAHVRHPIYLGLMLILLGLMLYHPTGVIVLSSLIILLYLPLGIYYEEKRLKVELGEIYEQYMTEVPCIFPKILK